MLHAALTAHAASTSSASVDIVFDATDVARVVVVVDSRPRDANNSRKAAGSGDGGVDIIVYMC